MKQLTKFFKLTLGPVFSFGKITRPRGEIFGPWGDWFFVKLTIFYKRGDMYGI